MKVGNVRAFIPAIPPGIVLASELKWRRCSRLKISKMISELEGGAMTSSATLLGKAESTSRYDFILERCQVCFDVLLPAVTCNDLSMVC